MNNFGNVVFIQPRVGEDGDCALKVRTGGGTKWQSIETMRGNI